MPLDLRDPKSVPPAHLQHPTNEQNKITILHKLSRTRTNIAIHADCLDQSEHHQQPDTPELRSHGPPRTPLPHTQDSSNLTPPGLQHRSPKCWIGPAELLMTSSPGRSQPSPTRLSTSRRTGGSPQLRVVVVVVRGVMMSKQFLFLVLREHLECPKQSENPLTIWRKKLAHCIAGPLAPSFNQYWKRQLVKCSDTVVTVPTGVEKTVRCEAYSETHVPSRMERIDGNGSVLADCFNLNRVERQVSDSERVIRTRWVCAISASSLVPGEDQCMPTSLLVKLRKRQLQPWRSSHVLNA